MTIQSVQQISILSDFLIPDTSHKMDRKTKTDKQRVQSAMCQPESCVDCSCCCFITTSTKYCKYNDEQNHITRRNASQTHRASPAICDHIVLPATWHRWTHPSNTRPVLGLSTLEGWRLSWPPGWLHTKMA